MRKPTPVNCIDTTAYTKSHQNQNKLRRDCHLADSSPSRQIAHHQKLIESQSASSSWETRCSLATLIASAVSKASSDSLQDEKGTSRQRLTEARLSTARRHVLRDSAMTPRIPGIDLFFSSPLDSHPRKAETRSDLRYFTLSHSKRQLLACRSICRHVPRPDLQRDPWTSRATRTGGYDRES